MSRSLAAILALGLIVALEALRPAGEPPGTAVRSESPGADGLPQVGASSSGSSVLPDVGLPSIEEPVESARLVLELQHPLSAGTLRVFIDEEEVAERAFSGPVTGPSWGSGFTEAVPAKPWKSEPGGAE